MRLGRCPCFLPRAVQLPRVVSTAVDAPTYMLYHGVLVLTQEPRLGGAETDFYPYTRLLSLFSRGWLLWMRTAASRREREVDTF